MEHPRKKDERRSGGAPVVVIEGGTAEGPRGKRNVFAKITAVPGSISRSEEGR